MPKPNPPRPDFTNFIIEHQIYSHNGEFLKLDGSNANTDIDIGIYNFTATDGTVVILTYETTEGWY